MEIDSIAKGKVFAVPSALLALCVIVVAVLFLFWDTQENKFHILRLALPFLVFIALFYFLAFKHLGETQISTNGPSTTTILLSATVVIGILTLVIYLVFLLIPGAPDGAVGTKPPAGEALIGILTSIFLPFWLGYILGGFLQLLLIKKYS